MIFLVRVVLKRTVVGGSHQSLVGFNVSFVSQICWFEVCMLVELIWSVGKQLMTDEKLYTSLSANTIMA